MAAAGEAAGAGGCGCGCGCNSACGCACNSGCISAGRAAAASAGRPALPLRSLSISAWRAGAPSPTDAAGVAGELAPEAASSGAFGRGGVTMLGVTMLGMAMLGVTNGFREGACACACAAGSCGAAASCGGMVAGSCAKKTWPASTPGGTVSVNGCCPVPDGEHPARSAARRHRHRYVRSAAPRQPSSSLAGEGGMPGRR